MKFLVEKITESHEQNKDWERAYHSLEKDYQALSERYETLRKMAFGVHSEKTKTIFNPDQTLLFNEAELAVQLIAKGRSCQCCRLQHCRNEQS